MTPLTKYSLSQSQKNTYAVEAFCFSYWTSHQEYLTSETTFTRRDGKWLEVRLIFRRNKIFALCVDGHIISSLDFFIKRQRQTNIGFEYASSLKYLLNP